jgi:Ricin-type beta-trefoil lectin domain/Transglycosylase SLT domain
MRLRAALDRVDPRGTGPWRAIRSRDRWVRPRRRTVVIAASIVLAVAGATTAMVAFDLASADNSAVPGKEVDAATAQTIMLAALSCPTLSGPNLAGQLMANSGFDPNAKTADGRTGVAALTSTTFKQWAPSSHATATDAAANIYALAHYMCDLVGQTRQAGIRGDEWKNALAAYNSGVGAVRKAGGIPADARAYVDAVSGYAAWYALQPVFSGNPASTGNAATALTATDVWPVVSDAAQVPTEDVAPILAAGSVCKQITPVRVAAQLMASSGFDPTKRATTGAMGIAGFLPDVWTQYASPSTSPWDPKAAISTVGRAMCDFVNQLSLMDQTDPYQLALAAFRVGPTAVRQASGVPKIASVQQFVSQVQLYVNTYGSDSRLTGAPGRPQPSGTPAPTPSPSPSPAHTPSPTPSAVITTPAPIPTATTPGTGKIVGYAGLCLDVVGGNSADGTAVQIWDCNNTAAQQWTLKPDGTIRALGKCLDVVGSRTTEGTNVDLWTCNGGGGQQWQPYSGGGGKLVNPLSGKCLDPGGAAPTRGQTLHIWWCAGGDNQRWVLP